MGIKMLKIEVWLHSTLGVAMSFIIANLPAIQAFVTFALTFIYFYYKIKEAKARAELREDELKNAKRKRR